MMPPLYRVWDVDAEEADTPIEERGRLVRAANHDAAATLYARQDVDKYGFDARWLLEVVRCADEGHDQRTIEVRCEVSYVPRVAWSGWTQCRPRPRGARRRGR